jgi:hypothetical protein
MLRYSYLDASPQISGIRNFGGCWPVRRLRQRMRNLNFNWRVGNN